MTEAVMPAGGRLQVERFAARPPGVQCAGEDAVARTFAASHPRALTAATNEPRPR